MHYREMLAARIFMFLLLMGMGGCEPSPFKGFIKGEEGEVVRIIDGDTFALNTGQVVRLVGLEAPRLGRRGEPDEPYAREAARALETLVLGRRVQLHFGGMTRDRYDRALAHVMAYTESGHPFWVNERLIETGAAWVRLYADNDRLSDRLFDAEARARSETLGVWNGGAFGPHRIEALEDFERGFLLVTVPAGAISSLMPLPEADGCYQDIGGVRLSFTGSARTVCEGGLVPDTDFEVRGWYSRRTLSVEHPAHIQPVGN